MAARRSVYRKAALDKLASPEELDRLMQITSPGSWLLLIAFAGVLVIALIWGIFGQITTTLEQSGVLTLSNPIVFIPSPEAGQVDKIEVAPGDRIIPGNVVAFIITEDGSVPVINEVEGRVLSVRAGNGEPVNAGSPLLSVESFDRETPQQEVIVYGSLDDRHRLRPGMEVQVLPSTVDREKYGYIKGEARSVAEFPANREEMLSVLSDAGFVDDLSGQGLVFEIRVALHTSESGNLIWSASDGPTFQIVSGTPCSVSFSVDQERPISKVFNLK